MSEMNASVQRSSATEPLRQTFHADPSRGDEPRDAKRAVVRLRVAEMDGSVTIEGYKLRSGEHFVTIYEDRFPAVKAQVRGPEHIEAQKLAERLSKTKRAEYVEQKMDGFVGTPAERDAFRQRVERECPFHWAQELAVQGKQFRTGLPVLLEAEIVERIGPPVTPENAARNANESLAEVLANAIKAANGTRDRSDQGDRKQNR